jgi:uncharacterized membrane protein (DUF2068 family)
MRATIAPRRPGHRAGLRLIAAFKLGKGALLLVAALGLLGLAPADLGARIEHWVTVLRMDPDSERIHALLHRVAGVDVRVLREFGVGSFVHSALLLTEGLGLWFERRWAEYLVVLVTASFVPFEVLALVRHLTALRALVLALNLVILGYLARAAHRRP